MITRIFLLVSVAWSLRATARPHDLLPHLNTDTIVSAVKTDDVTVLVKTLSDGKRIDRTFRFPASIRDFIVIPHIQGQTIFIAASPQDTPDWLWGRASLADTAAGTSSVATRWSTSPPHDAKLLAVEMTGGDSVVIHASRLQRESSSEDKVLAFTYVNHCPVPVDGRDFIGKLYQGELKSMAAE